MSLFLSDNFNCKYGEILSTYEMHLWVKPYVVLYMIDTFWLKRCKYFFVAEMRSNESC
jgi:hypothetical protein